MIEQAMCKHKWDSMKFQDESVALDCTLCGLRLAIGADAMVYDKHTGYVGKLDLNRFQYITIKEVK